MTQDPNKLPSKSDKLTSMLLVEIHNKLIDIEEKLNEKHEQQHIKLHSQEPVKITQENIKPLFEQLIQINTDILKELKNEADEGEVMRLSGTVTTTEFTILNTITDPGHPIKAFEFNNDGENSIYVGFNVVLSGEGADIIDVTNNLSRFDLIQPTEDISYSYNRRKIRNIYLLSSGGDSTYRLKLIW